jgi:LssY C-terminus
VRLSTAPVSNLYLRGHEQDLAIEKMIGGDPRHRHHVRFWQSPEHDELGRTLWIGAVTLDAAVGLSRRTGRLTHHIGPDIDQARDQLLQDLRGTPAAAVQWLKGFQTELQGRNGDGVAVESVQSVLSSEPEPSRLSPVSRPRATMAGLDGRPPLVAVGQVDACR